MAGHRNNQKSTLTSQQIGALAALRRDLLDDATFPMVVRSAESVHLEAYALTLSDVCDALGVTAAEREDILGPALMDYIHALTAGAEPDVDAMLARQDEAEDLDYVTVGHNRIPVLGTIVAGDKVDLSPFGEAVLHLWSVDGK